MRSALIFAPKPLYILRRHYRNNLPRNTFTSYLSESDNEWNPSYVVYNLNQIKILTMINLIYLAFRQTILHNACKLVEYLIN